MTNSATEPYPCTQDGYFAISSENQLRYCPFSNRKCDYVLCTFYPDRGAFVRVFYKCPSEDSDDTTDEYEFNESSQTCVKRPSPVRADCTTEMTVHIF